MNTEILKRFRVVGDNVIVHDLARILYPENIEIGSNVIIDDFVFIGVRGRLVIGNNVHIAGFVSVVGHADIVIQDFSGVSWGSRLFSSSDDFRGYGLTGPTVPVEFRNVKHAPINLGRHVILGANTVVLPGVTIGEGTSVGANCVVHRDLSAWRIYAFHPLREIGARSQQLLEKEHAYLASLSNRNPNVQAAYESNSSARC